MDDVSYDVRKIDMANQQNKMTIKKRKQKSSELNINRKQIPEVKFRVVQAKVNFVNGELTLGEQHGRRDEPEILILI